MREALASPCYFGNLIGGPSWAAWRVLLIAIVGEALTEDERVILAELTGRENEPGEPVEEFWGVIGRRGGKTRAIAVLGAFLAACVDHREHLAPGERGILPILAATTVQAQQAFNFVVGTFRQAPHLASLVTNQTADTLSLATGVDITVRPASYRTIRGVTAIGAIADEIGFWWNHEASQNPDKEVVAAIRPALATTGGPLIAISSPHARRGELYASYRRHFGPNGHARILVAQAPSRRMNPTLRQSVVDRAYEEDPAAAKAEYGAEFRTDIETYVAREVVDAATVTGRHELPPCSGVMYAAFVDPSGGSADSMTLAIGHRDGEGRAIVDALRERRPPFSPEAVVLEFAELLKSYRVSKVTGDRYAGEWPREQFRKHGISYELSDRTASDIFRDALPLLNSGKVELLDIQRLTAQLVALERRTTRGGKDSISHPPGGHDDIAVAVCGACLLVGHRAPMIVSPEAVARASMPARLSMTSDAYRTMMQNLNGGGMPWSR